MGFDRFSAIFAMMLFAVGTPGSASAASNSSLGTAASFCQRSS
ncbi:hypothetical protein [Sinorhizobium medicae]